MDKLRTNYTSRLRYRKVICLLQVVGFAFFLAGFATPYWVSFFSSKSKLDSFRGLFATCVTTNGIINCADIETFTATLIVSDVFACLAAVAYITALVASLLVINWLLEQRPRLVKMSIVINFLTGCIIILALILYYVSARDIEGSPHFAFYFVTFSALLILVTGVMWVIDFHLPEPKKPRIFVNVPALSTILKRVETPVKKI